MDIEFVRRLRDAVRSKARRNGDPTVSYFFTRRSNTPIYFGLVYLKKGQCDNTAVSSVHFASSVCQRFFFCNKINRKYKPCATYQIKLMSLNECLL